MPLSARVLGLLMLLLVPACIREELEPVRVGLIHWPGTEPLFLARELGLFEDRSVHLVEYASLGALNRAFRNGVIDAAHVTLDMALVLQQHGLEPRVVLVLDYSFVDKLLTAGAHTIFDSSELPEEIIDVLVVREDSLGRRSEQVRHLLQAWFQALDYLKSHPDDASQSATRPTAPSRTGSPPTSLSSVR